MMSQLLKKISIAAALASLIACAHISPVEDIAARDAGFSKFNAYTQTYQNEIFLTQSHATGHVEDLFFTHWKDGGTASQKLNAKGEFVIHWQGGGYNYVGGPGWSSGDRNRVIGYHLNEDSGANYVTLYGWGYDKTMDPKDPAHLVEYYVLQRTIHDRKKQNGEFGKTFVSNGIEYSTYRTIREEKPSINNTETFYQYWSIPKADLPLGQDHKIIFADHVKAWEATGWIIPDMNNIDGSDDPTYQVFAIEVFNPAADGVASGRVWDAKSSKK
nr:glycoside hydrolase family 11 protein [Providencia huaxiensis]